jgi:hypothetical protein
MSWAFVLTLLLVVVGFFPIVVVFWVGALFVATIWRAAQ